MSLKFCKFFNNDSKKKKISNFYIFIQYSVGDINKY